MSDEKPRCEGCGHDEAEGCGCPPLTLESMGLLPFMQGEGLRCPKCQMLVTAMIYHERITFSLSGDKTPCQEWVEKNLLGGTIGEHLCVRCQQCQYGFPMRTADA